MNHTAKIIVACLMLVTFPRLSESQEFELSPASSGYVFFPSGEGPGIPGCQPNEYRCDFGIAGTIGVAVENDVLTFASTDFVLSGNQAVQDNPPFSSAAVNSVNLNEMLTADDLSLTLVSSDNGTSVYSSGFGGFGAIEAAISGNQLTLTGGRDDRPLDGDAAIFDVRATLVPEPSSLLIVLAAVPFFCFMRRVGPRNRPVV